jgi:hypothetical protein
MSRYRPTGALSCDTATYRARGAEFSPGLSVGAREYHAPYARTVPISAEGLVKMEERVRWGRLHKPDRDFLYVWGEL